jgi:L-aminopeptidase/D-esterase-like protein
MKICRLYLYIFAVLAATGHTQTRGRDLGIPFDGAPGPTNSIVDVKGVEVGQTTLISGEGKLQVGKGPVRTGVTAVLPRGRGDFAPVFAGMYSLNGNGEMTGTIWVEESGILDGPVMITNTHSVGVVRDAVIKWRIDHGPPDASGYWWSLPVVAETYDGYLNDVNGFHVKPEHAFAALDNATSRAPQEGNVGGGTGMVCNGFKGGIGSASRKVEDRLGRYTVGVLVQCNYGSATELRISGINVGRELEPGISRRRDVGSIIVVVATDAPLLPHQLKRIARRVPLGLGRLGSYSGDGSGDIFIAFSTAKPATQKDLQVETVQALPNEKLDPIFLATVRAVEEAVVNAMIAARDMTGADDHRVNAIPHDKLQQVLKKYGRLAAK